jgi:hypothetical protein
MTGVVRGAATGRDAAPSAPISPATMTAIPSRAWSSPTDRQKGLSKDFLKIILGVLIFSRGLE